jgi:hypothetical protein
MHPTKQSACRHTQYSPDSTRLTSIDPYAHVLGVKRSRVHPAFPTIMAGRLSRPGTGQQSVNDRDRPARRGLAVRLVGAYKAQPATRTRT